MNNFVRLVRFAWPYRVRFGLSLVCAMFVATLYMADIAAVYPLLRILFYDDNCQTWIAHQISNLEADERVVDAKLGEVDLVLGLGDPDLAVLSRHFGDVHTRRDQLKATVVSWESRLDASALLTNRDRAEVLDRAELEKVRRDLQVEEARLSELKVYVDAYNRGSTTASVELQRRRQAHVQERTAIDRSLLRYHWMQPLAERYLPHHGFETLLLLMGLVMLGVMLKGVFLFLQEVFVANVMQLTLFDIRNHFYRRTMALDLSSFSDQGTAELISRFTNDMDSVGRVSTPFSAR